MANVPLINVANRHSDQVALSPLDKRPAAIVPFVAGGALTPKRIVKFATAAGQVIQSTAAADAHIGVYQGDVAAATGDEVPIGVTDIVDVEAGAAITQGASLSSDANARAVTAVSTNAAWGVALQSASGAGVIIKAKVGARAILA